MGQSWVHLGPPQNLVVEGWGMCGGRGGGGGVAGSEVEGTAVMMRGEQQQGLGRGLWKGGPSLWRGVGTWCRDQS